MRSDVITRVEAPVPATESGATIPDRTATGFFSAAGAVVAKPADLRELRRARRRRRRLISLVAAVALPTTLSAGYLYGIASDQYVTEFRFNVRRQIPVRTESASGTGALSGGNPAMEIVQDSEVVVQYLKSRQVIQDVASRIDLDKVWARQDADYLSRMDRDAPVEDKLRHWKAKVDPFFDMSNGLVTIQVRAFSPEDSLALASAVLELSERLINEMNRRAQKDAVAYARQEVEIAEERVKRVQVDLAVFRNANSVLFPAMNATIVANVEAKLRERLADARAQYTNQSAQGVAPNTAQMRSLRTQITSLEEEILRVRSEVTGAASGSGKPLATVLAGYTALEVEEKLATKGYERAQANLQQAHAGAARQQVYLNAFVRPTLAERSLYPVRWRLLLQIALGSFVIWCLLMLVWQAARDHAD